MTNQFTYSVHFFSDERYSQSYNWLISINFIEFVEHAKQFQIFSMILQNNSFCQYTNFSHFALLLKEPSEDKWRWKAIYFLQQKIKCDLDFVTLALKEFSSQTINENHEFALKTVTLFVPNHPEIVTVENFLMFFQFFLTFPNCSPYHNAMHEFIQSCMVFSDLQFLIADQILQILIERVLYSSHESIWFSSFQILQLFQKVSNRRVKNLFKRSNLYAQCTDKMNSIDHILKSNYGDENQIRSQSSFSKIMGFLNL